MADSLAMNVWRQPSTQIMAQLTMLTGISMYIHALTHSVNQSFTQLVSRSHTHTHTHARTHACTHTHTYVCMLHTKSTEN